MLFLILLICVCAPTLTQDIDKPCFVDNIHGICKIIYECPYARKLVRVDQVKPPTCSWQGTDRIVCCPLKNLFHRTGVFKKHFMATDGVKKSKHMTCRYDGNQPLRCCENVQPVAIPPEPESCPKLPRPRLPKNHIAWTKCLDYQRYVNKCVPVDPLRNPDKMRRESTCGDDSVFRISGGVEASPRQFPHMAVIGSHNSIDDDADIKWVGAGSLISERFILTATHILSEPIYGRVHYALLGTLNKTDIRSGNLYNIIALIPHPEYDTPVKANDIALIELDRQVFFNEFIRPACLPVPGRKVAQDYIIVGWGEDSKRNSHSVLLTAKAKPSSKCKTHFSFNQWTWSDEKYICAIGDLVGSVYEDTCQGDSGGPLLALMTNIHCSYSIEGIVSFGPNCGSGSPAAYTNVSSYLDWITNYVWPEDSKKNNHN